MKQNNFQKRVLDIVRKIPKGKTLSYKQVATLAGSENASRAVGTILAKNQDKNIPCHRVIKSDGTVGGYNGLRTNTTGQKAKFLLLKKEGILLLKTRKNGIK